MNEKGKSKLLFRKTTLRILSQVELGAAVGGVSVNCAMETGGDAPFQPPSDRLETGDPGVRGREQMIDVHAAMISVGRVLD